MGGHRTLINWCLTSVLNRGTSSKGCKEKNLSKSAENTLKSYSSFRTSSANICLFILLFILFDLYLSFVFLIRTPFSVKNVFTLLEFSVFSVLSLF